MADVGGMLLKTVACSMSQMSRSAAHTHFADKAQQQKKSAHEKWVQQNVLNMA